MTGAFGWPLYGEYFPEEGAGDEINVPVIAATTTLWPPVLSTHFDIDVPFIAATTVLYPPGISEGPPRRLAQLPVEVLVLGDPPARFAQVPIEVLVQARPPAVLDQLVVEVLRMGESDAALDQLPVEVLRRNLRETVIVVLWE